MKSIVLLAAALFGSSVFADTQACKKTAVAKSGDTCATLANANSITVQQFLTSNPTITTCALLTGYTYCVAADGTNFTPIPPATPIPTTSKSSTAVPSPTGSLIPSPDGSDGICGYQYTCLGSVYGDCCSAQGYCGNTTDYCGDGCNPVFGRCGGGSPPDGGVVTITASCPVGGSPSTTTVVSIVTSVVTITKTASTVVTVTATPTYPKPPAPTEPGTYEKCK
jgi:hypothetical protein